jgi:hypothetical protein
VSRGSPSVVGGSEPDALAVQLPFIDHDLVAQCEDFRVLGPVTHGQRPQQRERVGHTRVRQSKQHGHASSSSRRHRSDVLWKVGLGKISP